MDYNTPMQLSPPLEALPDPDGEQGMREQRFGLEAVNPQAMELMHVLSASRTESFRYVRWPSSLPYLFSAMRIASTSSVLGARTDVPEVLAASDEGRDEHQCNDPDKRFESHHVLLLSCASSPILVCVPSHRR